MRVSKHYLALGLAIALGTFLRFWQLDSKPLWLDEVITALFSLGRSYNDIPLDVLFPLNQLEQIFTLNQQASCSQISHTLATQSTHPPLFFCLMHGWLGILRSQHLALSTQLRSLPVLFGVGAIAAMYCLNRVAFSPKAGLIAASLMAVSPFAGYLSQESRHYTLPMVLTTLALLGLILIQQDFSQRRSVRPVLWIFWVAINTIGLYTHYFFILGLVAQISTLLGWQLWRTIRQDTDEDARIEKSVLIPVSFPLLARMTSLKHSRKRWNFLIHIVTFISFCLLPFAFFLPWLSVLMGHFNRPETEWSKPFEPSWLDSIVPVYQTIAGWVLMAIALPVENQPLWIAIPAALLMIAFAGWLVRQVFLGTQELVTTSTTHLSIWTLVIFTLFVLLEFFAIVYVLGKDITSAVRYQFIYYPSICALLGASLSQLPVVIQKDTSKRTNNKELFIVLLIGILSSIFVVSNLVFQKPYDPKGVAENMNLEPSAPLVVVVGYETFQEVALGLSFAVEVHKLRPDRPGEMPMTYFAFLKRSPSYQQVWQNLLQLQQLPSSPLNFWLVAPGLRKREYPPQLALANSTSCTLDPTQHYRIGIPYQLYRCQLSNQTEK